MSYPVMKNVENFESADIDDRSLNVEDGKRQNKQNSVSHKNIDIGLTSRIQTKPLNTQPKASAALNLEQNKAKVKSTELILFTTQLSVMLDSGVVLSDALNAIAEQAENGTFKIIIMEISRKIKSGEIR